MDHKKDPSSVVHGSKSNNETISSLFFLLSFFILSLCSIAYIYSHTNRFSSTNGDHYAGNLYT
jgi:hypothetical protein